MATELSDRDALAATIRRALLPKNFPFRRDVELHAQGSDAAGHVFFHDHHWLNRSVLAVSVVRCPGRGLDGALAATALRQLLRAALAHHHDPQTALATAAAGFAASEFSAAVACLDVADGTLLSASLGEAGVAAVPEGNRVLEPGDLVWLSAGRPSPAPPATTDLPVAGLRALVEPALGGMAGGCVAAVLFRGAARTGNSATFVIDNDAEAVPAFLGELDDFLTQRRVREDDVAGVDVAMDELLGNTISYAFADGAAHEIVVALSLEDGHLEIELRDDGAPFDPLGVPVPDLSGDVEDREIGGLGMHFVRTIMDEIAYSRRDGWNVLTMQKRFHREGEREETQP